MKKSPARLALKILIALAVMLIAKCAFIATYGLASTCQPDANASSTALVILGNRVYSNGQMSPVLKARVDTALDAYRKGCASTIIASGGLGKEGHHEGSVMAAYLIAEGVPASSVIADDQGINSRATAVNAKRIMAEQGLNSAIVVTSYYHVFRSELAMRQVGIEHVDGVGSRYMAFEDILKIPRDLAGVYVYLFKYGS